MSRGSHIAALAFALAALAVGAGACATSDGNAAADAAQNSPPDAALEDIDATVASVDASVADAAGSSIDAATGVPDAVANSPDATPGVPDADPPDADPPDADPPDADPPDAAPPDACVPEWIILNSNADFEAGSVAWTEVGGTIIREYGNGYPWPTNDGTWAALLGGANDASHQLTQPASVPANATDLRVRLARCFVTEEITTVTQYDTLTIQIRGLTTEELIWSNLDAADTCSWEAFTVTSPNAHAGETITLSFDADTDFSNITSFGLDSVVLEAFACP